MLTITVPWRGLTWLTPGPEDRQGLANEWAMLSIVCYGLPAVLVVLTRPNEGAMPDRLEYALSRAPAWLRVQPASA